MTGEISTADRSSHAVGVSLILLATVAWSLSGLFTRFLTTDVWTAIAWRSFFGGLFLLIPYTAINGRKSPSVFLSIGWPGILLATCQVICQACTVGALYLTSVANVTVIYATAPFMAAGLAWWLFGESVKQRTIVAAMISMAGIVAIVAGSLGEGHILGDLLAVGMTISFAFVIVIPRTKPNLPMLPTTILSAFATMALFSPLSAPTGLDAHNWTTLAAFGLTNFSIALFLFLFGARRIPSAEAALIGTLEIVLAPVWVWLLLAEQPTTAAIAGGVAVLSAVVWHTISDLRETKRH